MEDKQINRWLRREFSLLGWTLLGYNLVMNILVMAAMVGQILVSVIQAALNGGDWMSALDPAAIAGNGWGYVAAIFVMVIVLWAWKGEDFWCRDVMVNRRPMTAGALLQAISLCIGAQMVNSLWLMLLEALSNAFGSSILETLEMVSGDTNTVSMFLYASILAPVFEELLFRGLILRSLEPFGKRFAIWGSALLFGIFHGNLIQIPFAFLVGLVLGYLTVEYHIGWAMLVHLFNNLVLADTLTRLMELLPVTVQDILSFGLFGGFFLISVGILICRRRDIAAYVRSQWVDKRCIKWLFVNPGVMIVTIWMLLNALVLL